MNTDIRTINGNRNSNRAFLYFALIILFLTTFPLAQGWLPLGDFRPRLLFIIAAIVLYTKRFITKDLLWLYLFFAYQLLAYLSVGESFNYIDSFSRLMEFLIPIAIVPSVLPLGYKKERTILVRFSIVTALITILLTLFYVITVDPDIIRNMVTVSAWEGIDAVRNYWKLGVCSYAFALIMMCGPPVLISRYFLVKKHNILYLLSALLVLYFVYVSQVTTTFFISVLMVVIVVVTRKMSVKETILITIVLLIAGLLLLSIILPVLMRLFNIETEIGSHLAGMYEFIFEGGVSSNEAYAVDGRVELYDASYKVFLQNPLFGSITSKVGGHTYLFDNLARYGIIGTTPLFLFFYYRFKITLSYLALDERRVYAICIIGFFLLATIKNISGIDHWAYMFLYIPCFLELTAKKI